MRIDFRVNRRSLPHQFRKFLELNSGLDAEVVSTAAKIEPIRTVIIVHRGFGPNLPICMRRAERAVGAGGRVVLLGDAANAGIGFGEHRFLDAPALQVGLEEFRDTYQHMSRSQDFSFERFCIERWFLIRNFLRQERLDGCLAIDSDVLLFCDVAEESMRFAPYAMTFGRWDSVRVVPHCNFIRGQGALEDFCDWVMECYRDPQQLKRITEINRKKFNAAWISDMSLLASWGARSRFPIGFLEDTAADGVGFDSCLDNTDAYVGCGYFPGLLRQWKKLVFHDGLPHGTIRGSNGVVPMKCLHYHGAMKCLMERHDQGRSDDWSVAWQMLKRKFERYPGKFQLFYRNYVAPWVPSRVR